MGRQMAYGRYRRRSTFKRRRPYKKSFRRRRTRFSTGTSMARRALRGVRQLYSRSAGEVKKYDIIADVTLPRTAVADQNYQQIGMDNLGWGANPSVRGGTYDGYQVKVKYMQMRIRVQFAPSDTLNVDFAVAYRIIVCVDTRTEPGIVEHDQPLSQGLIENSDGYSNEYLMRAPTLNVTTPYSLRSSGRFRVIYDKAFTRGFGVAAYKIHKITFGRGMILRWQADANTGEPNQYRMNKNRVWFCVVRDMSGQGAFIVANHWRIAYYDN